MTHISLPELTSCSKSNFYKSKMADGRHFNNCYLRNHLTNFDEISMAMDISHSVSIGDQKFENSKI